MKSVNIYVNHENYNVISEEEYIEMRKNCIECEIDDMNAFNNWLCEKYCAYELFLMDEFEKDVIWNEWKKYVTKIIDEEFEANWYCRELRA